MSTEPQKPPGSGMLSWYSAEWETTFFGITTARLKIVDGIPPRDLEEVCAQCHESGVRVIHALIDAAHTEDSRQLENCGFHLVDVRITLDYRNQQQSPRSMVRQVGIRPARATDLQDIEVIARQSFDSTRYYADPGYPKSLCDDLYAEWARKSCSGHADAVAVAEFDDRVVGFMTLHNRREENRGEIGLMGLSPMVRGQNIGRFLVEYGIAWFVESGLEYAQVVTQGRNIAAQRLYQRCGFRTQHTQLWYHKWL